MNFDIKDVKSWSTRNEVELGKIGFFADSIEQLYKEECVISKLSLITKKDAFSFGDENNNSYAFFLPLEAVKEDKPKEKKYQPFKNLYEFYQFLSFNSHITEEDFTPVMLLGLYFKYREKKALRVASTIVINRIDVDLKDICNPLIEGRNLELWFDLAEIMNDDGEWQPFGVEVKEND